MQIRWVSVKCLEWMLVLSAEGAVIVSCKPETKQVVTMATYNLAYLDCGGRCAAVIIDWASCNCLLSSPNIDRVWCYFAAQTA